MQRKPNFLKEIKFILGQRFCDPEELSGEKLRNTLSSSDITRCFQIDGIFAQQATRMMASARSAGLRSKSLWRRSQSATSPALSEEVEGEGSGGYPEKEMTRLMRTAA